MSTRRRTLQGNMSTAGTSGGARTGLIYDGLEPAVQQLLQRRPLESHTSEILKLLKHVMQHFLKINKYPFRSTDKKSQLLAHIMEMVSKAPPATSNCCCASANAAPGDGTPGGISNELMRSLPMETVEMLRTMEQRPKTETETLLLSYGEPIVHTDSHAALLKQLANMLYEQTRAQQGVEVRRDGVPLAKRQRVSMTPECSVCMEHAVSAGFSPCGHAVSCKECAAKLKICPICRKDIESVLHLFFS